MKLLKYIKARLMMFIASLFASLKAFRQERSGYAKVVGGLVGLMITIIIGILVYWQISGSITLSSDTANTSRDNVDTTASTVFLLLPIIAIVVIGSILIGLVAGFGGSGGGGGGRRRRK